MTAQIIPVESGNLASLIADLAARGLQVLIVASGSSTTAPAITPSVPATVPTVSEAIKTCLESKRARGLRKGYLASTASNLKIFAQTFGGRPINSIKPDEIEHWLQGQDWVRDTQRGVLLRLRVLFGFAVKRGWACRNVGEDVDLPATNNRPPGVLTVEAAAKLMEAAAIDDPPMAAFFAVQLFGGLRANEAQSLCPEQIKDAHIEITADKCKTRRRRLVPINDTLRAWLRFAAFPVSNWRQRLERIRESAGVTMPRNCLRHSFVSYSVPIHGAALTASWAGHTESVLFANYRELVTEANAREFWAIRP